MLTVNRAEARALMQRLDCSGEKGMMHRLRAESMLLTRDSSGWRFYDQDGNMVESPAAPAPEHTDFIGCGEYAAAGAVHAVVHGLDLEATINGFIQRKLESNVMTPRSLGIECTDSRRRTTQRSRRITMMIQANCVVMTMPAEVIRTTSAAKPKRSRFSCQNSRSRPTQSS